LFPKYFFIWLTLTGILSLIYSILCDSIAISYPKFNF
jgi:hypothetical protein